LEHSWISGSLGMDIDIISVSEHILTSVIWWTMLVNHQIWGRWSLQPNRFHDAERRIAWALEKDTVAPSFHRVDWDGMIALV
jgi:hypothetical protein